MLIHCYGALSSAIPEGNEGVMRSGLTAEKETAVWKTAFTLFFSTVYV